MKNAILRSPIKFYDIMNVTFVTTDIKGWMKLECWMICIKIEYLRKLWQTEAPHSSRSRSASPSFTFLYITFVQRIDDYSFLAALMYAPSLSRPPKDASWGLRVKVFSPVSWPVWILVFQTKHVYCQCQVWDMTYSHFHQIYHFTDTCHFTIS